MTFDPPLDHEALLTLARKAEAAIRDDDHDRLATAVQRLSDALVDHVGAERPQLEDLPAGESALLEHGQERVLELLAQLSRIVGSSPAFGSCHCVSLARQLLAHLSLQGNHERLAGVSISPNA
jgi:hypothetical protein